MTQPKRNPLFENGIDSIKTAVQIYVDKPFHYSNKHAILTLFHGIELILKARLYEIHELLIYSNIDKEIREDSYPVGIKEIKVRLKNLGLDLADDELEKLDRIQKRRNKIQHHFYDQDLNDLVIIGEGLEFIDDILRVYFERSLEKVLPKEEYLKIQKIIREFERSVSLAEKMADEAISPKSKDDLCKNDVRIFCPSCSQNTLVLSVVATI